MAANLESLIQQVQALDATDLQRLREAIDVRIEQTEPLAGTVSRDTGLIEEEFQRRLLEAGVIREIRKPIDDPAGFRAWEPIPIGGKPVSETIIEERR